VKQGNDIAERKASLRRYTWTKSIIPAVPAPSSSFDPSSLRCEWLWVYDALVPTTDVWSKEIVVPPGVFFVISGLGRIKADGQSFELPPGTAFFSAPGTRRQWFADGTRLLSVGFRATWPDALPLFSKGLNASISSSKLSSLQAATRRLFRSVHGTRRSVTYREATTATMPGFADWCAREAAFRSWFAIYVKTLDQLCIHPTPRQRPTDERLHEILRRLNAWPLARPLSVDDLVDGLDIGIRRLEQLLAEDLGLTPHGHLNRRRVESARHLLASTTTPLKQVAHELGFHHASHFTKWFRKHAGMAPSSYRDGGTSEAA